MVVLVLLLANFGQAGTEPGADSPGSTRWERGMSARVGVDSLEVWDAPRQPAYEVGRFAKGDRVRIRGVVRGGWLAIERPSWAICWVERGSLELGEEGVGDQDHRHEPAASPLTAWVKGDGAVVRSGNPRARLPGPPRTRLEAGTMTRLVDRPPVGMGRADAKRAQSNWLAIAPPDDLVYFVRAAGLEPLGREKPRDEAVRVMYRPDDDPPRRPAVAAKPIVDPPGLPAEVAAELKSLDRDHRAVVSQREVAAWRFEAERARSQAILKRAGDDPRVREAVSARLARLERDERSAAAAREVEATLAHMRRLDGEVDAAERKLAASAPKPARGYTAIGFMKPSNQFLEGRKLYALIGTDGKTTAFLDIPPGLEIEPITAGRVGVRGRSRFDEDLSVPLITVRELEPVARGR